MPLGISRYIDDTMHQNTDNSVAISQEATKKL